MRPLTSILLVALLVMIPLAPGGVAAEATYPDRESTYPAGVANVSHAPWRPRAGDDVVVTLTLAPDADVPQAASLLFCRVEPDYVCTARPPAMQASEDGRTWTATIVWDGSFMRPETRHVGYNITLRHIDPDAPTAVRREHVPLGNHWVPASYPEEADGIYYFVAYSGSAKDSPLPPLAPFVALLFALVVALRRGGGDRHG